MFYMKLIPDWHQQNLTCDCCGATKSVKYEMNTRSGKKICCNKCILKQGDMFKEMTHDRAMELLNLVIDFFMVGENIQNVIRTLLHIGFTKEELVKDFGFAIDDVEGV